MRYDRPVRLFEIDGRPIYHDIQGSFNELLRSALEEDPIGVALGPLYKEDPALELIAPFFRSARESGWSVPPAQLAPDWIVERASALRAEEASRTLKEMDPDDLNDWTRAGIVLEIASRRGFRHRKHGMIHTRWKLNGTVTGRFGVEPGSFNPMVMDAEERGMIVPRDAGRKIVVIDFRGIDVCSMILACPDHGLRELYAGSADPHARTAELLFGESGDELREIAKSQIFTYAYGGQTPLKEDFEKKIPPLRAIRSMQPHGEGARFIQKTSARAFRAALSHILPSVIWPDISPMFAVHDELVLDVAEDCDDCIAYIVEDMSAGATRRIAGENPGIRYSASITWGSTYGEAKEKG